MRDNGGTQALAPVQEQRVAPMGGGLPRLTTEQVQVLKNTVAKGVSDAELQLFIAVCNRTGLDPFSRQIYAVKYGNQPMFVHTGIDGLRLIAHRSGLWEGIVGPYYCGPDGEWTDVWLKDAPPAAAKVGILRRGWREAVWGVALWKSCFNPNSPLWKTRGTDMLGKNAEAAALRRAFQLETADLAPTGTPREVGFDPATGEILERAEGAPAAPSLPPPVAAGGPRARIEEGARAGEIHPDYGAATGARRPNQPTAKDLLARATADLTAAAREAGLDTSDKALMAHLASAGLGREVRSVGELDAADRGIVATWIRQDPARAAEVAFPPDVESEPLTPETVDDEEKPDPFAGEK